ncbi:hypothetical protein NLX67_00950 [Domibacillus sp. A3M-37]|uniref:hypothetical protein n=1 Tax=Domibacillus sp. A3M-37 TaxID=2962037 RepID=UPI0020B7AE38|nr:hypothetical protein [Domibacillus sp. A3M-37]MCP3760962.1 hypothetical protein [Domibacillus sp. A3M-37]
MKKWIFASCLFAFLTGCAEGNQAKFDGEFAREKQAAWAFLQEQDWTVKAEEMAAVNVTKERQDVEWIRSSDSKKWVAVSFAEEKRSVTGIPIILIEPETKEVVGYIPGE